MKMNIRQYVALVVCVCMHTLASAQSHAQETAQIPGTEKDSSTIASFFRKGKFTGHARSYMSATVNQDNLTDWYAWGLGAGMGYQTPRLWKRLQAGISGFFIFNLASSDLSQPDPVTGQMNRYEIGLFDIERPDDHKDLDRLEELFARLYVGKQSVLTVGRQIPETPFINPQDGRMRPTLIEGAMVDWKEWKNLKLQGGYIWAVSPRSTVRWFGIGESVGVYSVGVNAEGAAAGYKNQLHSDYVAVAGLTYYKTHWEVQVWDMYIQNMLHTGLLKLEWQPGPAEDHHWLAGVQVLRQGAVGEGGNADPMLAYVPVSHAAMVFSGRVGHVSPHFDWFINATRITSEGEYLQPREWGREPLYTYLSRERNEGMGDVTATSINTYIKPHKDLKIEISGGYFRLPEPQDYRLNKYGLPSYTQLNVSLRYHFEHFWKGLEASLLVVRKDEVGQIHHSDQFVFNKVNMTHANLVLNYHY